MSLCTQLKLKIMRGLLRMFATYKNAGLRSSTLLCGSVCVFLSNKLLAKQSIELAFVELRNCKLELTCE